MAHKLILEIPIRETRAHGNVYYELAFKEVVARTNLPVEEREAILETLGQSDYIYTDMGPDLLTAFAQAPESELP